jgi:hypothetical protein
MALKKAAVGGATAVPTTPKKRKTKATPKQKASSTGAKAPRAVCAHHLVLDLNIDRLVEIYGVDAALRSLARHGKGRGAPPTWNNARILGTWACIEAARLRYKCKSAAEACKKLSGMGGLSVERHSLMGGIGDLVVLARKKGDTARRRAVKKDSGAACWHCMAKSDTKPKTVTNPETLEAYHARGENHLKTLAPAAQAAWRDFAEHLALK